MKRRTFLQAMAAATAVVPVAACTSSSSTSGSASTATSTTEATTTTTTSSSSSLVLDHTAWRWDQTNDVYWQLGVVYVSTPAAKDYETLGVYVPGAYLSATKNSNGTYTATVKAAGTVGSFTAATAPIVLPVNTPGYAAQRPPTSYSYNDAADYLKAGFVYVAAGLRGRDSSTTSRADNAPWGVTDLKAAIRYVRYNAGLIPGATDRVFVFGMSGGGAQSAVAGASGDSALYTPYLRKLGAAMTTAKGTAISDAVNGVMAWCPITSLDYANASYEWNMGQFASSGTRASGTWTTAYSGDLSTSFAAFVNKLGLTSPAGTRLALAKSASGTYLAGTYYDYVLAALTTSLNDFLADTTFPYTPTSTGGGPPGMSSSSSSSSSTSTTYQTVAAYLAHLNSDTTWVSYNTSTKKATVLNLAGFVRSQKSASKDVGAFDGVARGATENLVLGRGTSALHFAPVSQAVLAANQSGYTSKSGWKSSYAAAEYTSDFATKDTLGKDVAYRQNMYNPMYYLSPFYKGYKTASVAPHWRIRTGVMQGDTANTTELNLLLALQNYGIDAVDFATVWGQGHTQAERTGSATSNFIAWVKTAVA